MTKHTIRRMSLRKQTSRCSSDNMRILSTFCFLFCCLLFAPLSQKKQWKPCWVLFDFHTWIYCANTTRQPVRWCLIRCCCCCFFLYNFVQCICWNGIRNDFIAKQNRVGTESTFILIVCTIFWWPSKSTCDAPMANWEKNYVRIHVQCVTCAIKIIIHNNATKNIPPNRQKSDSIEHPSHNFLNSMKLREKHFRKNWKTE